MGPYVFADFADIIAKKASQYSAENLLEVAAGTGIVSKVLHEVFPKSTQLVITDLNEPMLQIARKKFNDFSNIEFKTADAMQLPFDNDMFDIIVSQFGVMFFPDKKVAFQEAKRVLRPNGRFLFSAWGSMAANPFSEIVFDVGAKFFPENPPLFYKVPFSYPDPDVAIRDLSAAGFDDISYEVIKIEKEALDWELFARGLVFGNPIIEEIHLNASVEPETVKNAVVDALTEKFGSAPTTMPLEAILFDCGVN